MEVDDPGGNGSQSQKSILEEVESFTHPKEPVDAVFSEGGSRRSSRNKTVTDYKKSMAPSIN